MAKKIDVICEKCNHKEMCKFKDDLVLLKEHIPPISIDQPFTINVMCKFNPIINTRLISDSTIMAKTELNKRS